VDFLHRGHGPADDAPADLRAGLQVGEAQASGLLAEVAVATELAVNSDGVSLSQAPMSFGGRSGPD
jgi:hypothetical protein